MNKNIALEITMPILGTVALWLLSPMLIGNIREYITSEYAENSFGIVVLIGGLVFILAGHNLSLKLFGSFCLLMAGRYLDDLLPMFQGFSQV